jgi:nucleoside-diphosphate-sugar epimerase
VSSILVTGGSGFVGSGLVKALVRAGHRVRVLDDNSRGSPRREVAEDIEFIACDIRDAAAVETAAKGMEEAARSGSRRRSTRHAQRRRRLPQAEHWQARVSILV